MKVRFVLVLALVAAGVTITGPSPVAGAAAAAITCAPSAPGPAVPAPELPNFEASTPRRLVDTRDGTGGVTEPVGDGCTLRLDLDAAAVPADAGAVALSVTALGSRPGFLTVFPCSTGLPPTSNVNTRSGGFPTPNLVVATPDADRMVCVYSQHEAELIVDLTGWWTEDGDQRLTTIAPVRADDTRDDPGRPKLPADTTRTIDLTDIVPPSATAVVANLTVTEADDAGFATAFPCGTDRPQASNLNYRAFESRAVAIVVGLGTGADLCVSSSDAAHVVVDIVGYYSPAPQFGPTPALQSVTGRRLADSRTGEGGWTTKFGAGTVRRIAPTAGLPVDLQATGVFVNVVATEAEAPGYVTVYPCGQDVPNSSAVNYAPGGESTNMVAVDLSAGGEICFFTLAPVHLVVDLFATVQAPGDALTEQLYLDGFTWPAYNADATDYVVECGTEPTDLHLGLLRNTTARVNGIPTGSGVIDLPVGEDDLTWVQLRRGATVRNHYFRCVPDDFPRLEIDRPGTPAPGWYLTTVRSSTSSSSFATILDHYGAPVWYKRLDRHLIDLKRRADGRLALVPELGPRYGVEPDRGYRVVSLAGTLVDELSTVGMPTDHHDYVEAPGGAAGLLSYPVVDGVDLSALGLGYEADDSITDGVIQEVAPNGTVAWSWTMSDDFEPTESTDPIRWGPFPQYSGNEVDVYHLNSLDRVFDGSGDYLVSARHLDAVVRVDRATGAVDWVLDSLGASGSYANGMTRLTVVGDPRGGPIHPHDARLRGDVLTLFDNRTGTGQPARAVAYRIDDVAKTATLLWQIEEPRGRTSGSLGSNRVAADGSVLVAWGAPIQPMFQEFAADHATVLMSITQPGASSYRIVKEPPASFSAATLRANAGGSLEAPG